MISHEEKKMVKKKWFWGITSVVLVAGIVAGLFLSWFIGPLAPALALNVPEKAADNVVRSVAVAQESNCGQTGAIVVMFLSYDSRDWNEPYGADMIRYFRADFSNLTIDEVALPRDLWMKTPVLVEMEIANYKLGKVFEYEPHVALKDQKDLIIASTGDVAQTVFDNFEVAPDKYVTLDAKIFATMIDLIGGIEIQNEYAFDTISYSFAPGQVVLTGAEASEYVREFNDDLLEVRRFSRQKAVLLSIWEKMTKPENITKLPKLNEQFQENYVTDLTPAQLTSLFCLIEKVTLEKMTTNDVTPQMFTVGGPDDSFLPDVEKITKLLKDNLFPQ